MLTPVAPRPEIPPMPPSDPPPPPEPEVKPPDLTPPPPIEVPPDVAPTGPPPTRLRAFFDAAPLQGTFAGPHSGWASADTMDIANNTMEAADWAWSARC